MPEPVSIWMRPERPARGPRPAYSRERITAAAIEIADAEGLEAASMRRVAGEIGTGAMSLYRYVPGREELIELMVDAVLGELDLPDRPSGDWRADLALLAHRRRALHLRHPWLLRVPARRPVFGPNQLRLGEFALGTLDATGLPIDELISLTGLLTGYLENFSRTEVGWAEEARRTGLDMDQWMAANSTYVNRLVSSGEYPMFARIVIEARQPHMDTDARFEYGLARVLDSIAAALPG
ncbi:TetR/AcrR family transcriptional regulator [Actinomadura craniellae]|uniref:TetR/AcrR family transcriptional regulator n=1 Tax=Actinomadura craniellae TaxID=2231787 RepID=A0A365H5D1_9ACTN|nr:TetR/AcrR family transcriptional regulator [Actinomadura craniellae]RAY14238.1 TetR/AcrR family transcriptional regulator [Actinomadura craniellae]